MDPFFSTQDTMSLSLQEMLDCDYKSDLESVLGTDLSLSLSGEFPPVDLEGALGTSDDMAMWLTNGCLYSENSNSSSSNLNLDLLGCDTTAVKLNPSTVLPVTFVTVPQAPPKTVSVIVSKPLMPCEEKLSDNLNTSVPSSSGNTVMSQTVSASTNRIETPVNQLSTALNASTVSHSVNKVITKTDAFQSVMTTKSVPNIISSTKFTQKDHVPAHQSNADLIARSLQPQPNSRKRDTKNFDMEFDERPYPKPAYSYSCLIAMALKNSRTGSLPVSEIYNFMCEHFPYFKTAPNGWKNSVRHNLSLNKCFEKIDKPSGNGSQQRKGCLWAMNPAKIAKMDEEVQKWSKKDPMAIKNAMICPENLELLERGEMKQEFTNFSTTGMLGGSEESDDEVESNGPNTPVSPSVLPELDINSMVVPGDSFDESSLDFDIEVAEGMYEEFERDDKLNIGITITPDNIEIAPSPKRSRSTVQGNYIYRQLSDSGSSRQKEPQFLRAASAALVKLENP
ncbi:forkhead box protein P2-like [Schistocerca cancellata]|uniref:forkhead box protein P2-like n=1 Tax=Schistocerca cancellata TaxID=274614 RepID=UPI0021172E72|nr:forkhead box protein P2-like [Schistocerca cancellata]XP_049783208.1 forkhead box protein P2-like [Schistocerca cancellata]XP_049783209.1 forkhead box protein P2-like [Schistocerca cancellata]